MLESESYGLTGSTRYRTNWLGKVILQVQEHGRMYCTNTNSTSPMQYKWRDATLQDLVIQPNGE